MSDHTLSIDPVAVTAAISRAAAAPIEATTAPVTASANAFDAAVAAFLTWATTADAAVVTTLRTRGQALASHATDGVARLAAVNTENARHLGGVNVT